MDGEHGLAASHRLLSLAAKFRDKQYRDGYVASHTRRVLAEQMRNFRGELSQADFSEKIGKQKTVVARLENPAYGGWSLRTMLEIARKRDVAVFIRFVDFPTFLKYTDDLSDSALQPEQYNEEVIDGLAKEEETAAREGALKALFANPPTQGDEQTAERAIPKQDQTHSRIAPGRSAPPGNDNETQSSGLRATSG